MKWVCRKCHLTNEYTKKCKKCGTAAKIIEAVKKITAGWAHREPAFLRQQRQIKGSGDGGILPRKSFESSDDFVLLGAGEYTIAILCKNPLKYGIELYFTDATQYHGSVVLRIVGDTSFGRPILETPQRVADLFNQLNSAHDIPQARNITISKSIFETMLQTLDGSNDPRWQEIRQKQDTRITFLLSETVRQIAVTPYISGLVPANDLQLSHYVVKNFIKYHRILLDAFNNDNAMQPTSQSNFTFNPNELVTLDASAFFEVFQTEVEKMSDLPSGRRRSYPSAFWVQHEKTCEPLFVGGVLLEDWIFIWEEKGSFRVPNTFKIVSTLLMIAYVGVDIKRLLLAFRQMNNDISQIIDFLLQFLDDVPEGSWGEDPHLRREFCLQKVESLIT